MVLDTMTREEELFELSMLVDGLAWIERWSIHSGIAWLLGCSVVGWKVWWWVLWLSGQVSFVLVVLGFRFRGCYSVLPTKCGSCGE